MNRAFRNTLKQRKASREARQFDAVFNRISVLNPPTLVALLETGWISQELKEALNLTRPERI